MARLVWRFVASGNAIVVLQLPGWVVETLAGPELVANIENTFVVEGGNSRINRLTNLEETSFNANLATVLNKSLLRLVVQEFWPGLLGDEEVVDSSALSNGRDAEAVDVLELRDDL